MNEQTYLLPFVAIDFFPQTPIIQSISCWVWQNPNGYPKPKGLQKPKDPVFHFKQYFRNILCYVALLHM